MQWCRSLLESIYLNCIYHHPIQPTPTLHNVTVGKRASPQAHISKNDNPSTGGISTECLKLLYPLLPVVWKAHREALKSADFRVMHSMTIMLGKHEQTAKWIKMTSCQGVHRVSPTSVVCTDVCPSNVALASRRCSRSLWRILWDYIVFNMLCRTMCHSVAHSSPCYLFSDASVYGCFRLSWANMQEKSRVEKIGCARIDTGCVLSLWEKIKIHMRCIIDVIFWVVHSVGASSPISFPYHSKRNLFECSLRKLFWEGANSWGSQTSAFCSLKHFADLLTSSMPPCQHHAKFKASCASACAHENACARASRTRRVYIPISAVLYNCVISVGVCFSMGGRELFAHVTPYQKAICKALQG